GDGWGEEGWAAGEEFVQDRAEGVDIAGDGEFAGTGGLFGGHVGRGTEEGVFQGQGAFFFEDAGEAEICDVRFGGRVEKDVGGFEVAVEDSVLVGVVDGGGDFGEEGGDGL